MKSIASDPDDIHMYNVADFSFLLDIVDTLTNNLCNSVKGPGVWSFTSEYAQREHRHLNLAVWRIPVLHAAAQLAQLAQEPD